MAEVVSDRPRAPTLAFACEPGAGSEEGVGWMWTVAVSQVAEVTLVTSALAADAVRAEVANRGLPIQVVALDLPACLVPLFGRKLVFVRYVIWQVAAARVVRRREREGQVDVVHHITWGSDSLPSALWASRAPVRVWGPVGGSTPTARGLYRYLSLRGRADQLFRDLVNGTLRKAFGERVARHATLVAALNRDVGRRFGHVATRVVVEPHVALHPEGDPGPAGPANLGAADWDGPTALFVGRLIPWKGLLLAVRALVHAPGWRLVVAGVGPERARAERLARELAVSHRVEFVGRVPREAVLAAFRTADALLFPSFHDSAPWSVGEATAAGCPVVCLDVGGPSQVAGNNAHEVPIRDGSDLAERLGQCLLSLTGRGEPDDRWSADRLPEVLRGWYRTVAEEQPSVTLSS